MPKESKQNFKKLHALAATEAKVFAQQILSSFDNTESVHHYLRALFYHHALLDQEAFIHYLSLMYEAVGSNMPEDLDCYLVMDQDAHTFTSCFLAAVLVLVLPEIGGDL
jgi:hypothetical protein